MENTSLATLSTHHILLPFIFWFSGVVVVDYIIVTAITTLNDKNDYVARYLVYVPSGSVEIRYIHTTLKIL
jgi:hypothetical protein